MQTTTIDFGTRQTRAAFPSEGEAQQIPALLQYEQRPTITLVGNTIFETPADMQACFELLTNYIYPLAERREAVLLAKGHSLSNTPEHDLAFLLKKAAASAASSVPLVGVALKMAVKYPGAPPEADRAEPLEAHYSDFVLVPGRNEEANSAWRSAIAREMRKAKTPAGQSQPGVTLVFGGAATTWFDVIDAVDQQCHVIAITSPDSSGICNQIGRGLSTGNMEQVSWLGARVRETLPHLPASGYLHAAPYSDTPKITALLRQAFSMS